MAGHNNRVYQPATRRADPARFARILLTMGSGASLWLVVAFVLGVMALGVLSNLMYDALADPASLAKINLVLVLGGAAGLVALAYLAYRHDLQLVWRSHALSATFDEKDLAPCRPGLIWLLSPGPLTLLLYAIRYHLSGRAEDRLRHCWVLVTHGTQEAYGLLAARVDDLDFGITLHPIQLEEDTIEAAYRAVESIYALEAGRCGLQPDQIISDLTGGFKPLSAGMVLACLPYGHLMEYIQSARHPVTGEPIEGTQRAVLVGVDFSLKRQRY